MASEPGTSRRSSTAPERAARAARVLHFDCFSGAAGNMLLGALLEVGAPLAAVREALAGLGVGKLRLRSVRVTRGALASRYVSFPDADRHDRHGQHDHHGRSFRTIRALLRKARLPARVRERSLDVFERLARAEGRIHGVPIERVHFHEVGALDALGDIVGVCAAVEALGVTRISAGALPLGHGAVPTEHGPIPLPAPATLELLRGLPTYPLDVAWETVTPTGAALLAVLADEFGALPALRPLAQGFGAGDDRKGPLPNVLRAVLGELEPSLAREHVALLETNLDDMSPEHLPFLMERLLEDGALDVSLVPLIMKKGRPGQLLRVIARPSDADRLARRVLADSSALGVRVQTVPRLVRARTARSVDTPYGAIRVKLAGSAGAGASVKPEYESCARAARRHKVSIATVTRAADLAASRELL
jgi:uncharacterized protein (TIGR00299 family) protein